MLLLLAVSGMGICASWHAKNPVSFLMVAGQSSTSAGARVSSPWLLSKACRVVTDGASAGRDCGSKAWAVLCPHLVMDLPVGQASRARLRGMASPARPYICPLIILSRLTLPST